MTDKFVRKPVLILKREKGSRIVESENNELQIGFWGADNSGRPRPMGEELGEEGERWGVKPICHFPLKTNAACRSGPLLGEERCLQEDLFQTDL